MDAPAWKTSTQTVNTGRGQRRTDGVTLYALSTIFRMVGT